MEASMQQLREGLSRAPQPAGQAKQTKPDTRTSSYTVQQRVAEQEFDSWRDVATVELPLRSHRRSAVPLALKEAGRPVEAGGQYRVLDAEAAGAFTLRAKPRPVDEDFEVVSA